MEDWKERILKEPRERKTAVFFLFFKSTVLLPRTRGSIFGITKDRAIIISLYNVSIRLSFVARVFQILLEDIRD